ncbi:Arc family DNA-binding protein [Halomonas daqingensis]|nr:Arc family DNA-binding protein [Halomonas desiderata]MCE8027557.1 Arc family DNA-binding protein [Halomonas desiderata]
MNLRMPTTLRTRIAEAAARNRRTATAEVLVRLEDSFRRDGIDPTTGEALSLHELAPIIACLASRLDGMADVFEDLKDQGSS